MMEQAKAKELYRMLYYLRYVEEVIAAEYRQGLMKCPIHLYTGQEGVAAGVALNLVKEDYVTSNHRSHGHYLAKGGDLKKLFAEIYCLPSGCTGGWGGSQHLYAPEVGILATSAIVSGGIPFATGIAQALKWEKKPLVSAVFFGDGATEEGNFYESLNFAALKKLPVLFVCENNGLAVHSPLANRRAPEADLAGIAQSLGVKALQVDGNDAIAVYRAAAEVITSMRRAPEPYFLEAVTYRWKGHVSPDEDHGERYRTPEEIARWKELCPLESFAGRFLQHHELEPPEIGEIQREVRMEVDAVVAQIKEEAEALAAAAVPASPY